MTRKFRELLAARWDAGQFICIGLDSDIARLPQAALHPESQNGDIVAFNRAIVGATRDLVCAYKLNPAFYWSMGDVGWFVLHETVAYIHDTAPDVPIILDAKYGDVRHTNEHYARFAFDQCETDAVTVHPYLGQEALEPFLHYRDKGIFVLCRTSNPGASEFQNLAVEKKPLYEHIAHRVAWQWNTNGNCGVIVGATAGAELHAVRKIVGDLPILIPGIGAQGGNMKSIIEAGVNSRRSGIIASVSRSVLFASHEPDFAAAARHETQRLQHQIASLLASRKTP